MTGTFVELDADRLKATLDSVGTSVQEVGGSYAWHVRGREIVFDLRPPETPGVVRVYTSVGVGRSKARPKGADAIRVLVGADVGEGRFFEVGKSRRIYRTASRIALDPVGSLLNRVVVVLRQMYPIAKRVMGCPECPGIMVLRESAYGKFYGCSNFPRCKATHGAHQGTGEPLGKPADQATRKARIEAHAAFDPLWKSGTMTRQTAYAWLREQLGLSKEECHMGRMDVVTCKRVVDVCSRVTGTLAPEFGVGRGGSYVREE